MTTVYVCLGQDWAVLYVGITDNLARRLSVHRCLKPWWPDVREVVEDSQHVEREDAAKRDRTLIELHRPPHNLNLLPGKERARRLAPARAIRESKHRRRVELRSEEIGSPLWDPEDAGIYVSEAPSSLVRRMRSGELGAEQIDRRWYTTAEALDRWVEGLPPVEGEQSA